MFNSHGHSHSGGSCNHGHGHSHSGGGRSTLGFGDDDDESKSGMGKPVMNPMMMAMMNAMKNNPNAAAGGNQMMMNPMMMAMMNQGQINPKMAEFAKKMMEQRQTLMKEFMEKGGQSNPDALQELMTKAAQAQAALMAEFKANMSNDQNNSNENSTPFNKDEKPFIPIPPNTDYSSSETNNTNAADLLSANLNSSKLDDLINKRNMNKKVKEEQEAKILEAIAKKDFSDLNAVKATQYGVLDRLKELVESGQTDPNLPDAENVYLLHWAAINNRLEIAKYLLKLGVKVDPVGGELETTPLNWAARSGHVQMCVLLMQSGADPTLYDIEGFSTIHLATMFGHSNVVAYLLVKGIDTDMPDKNGLTPLMYAAQRVHSRDPAQLLLTFNARINAQDPKGNTALHYCVAFNNANVMEVLLNKGASLDIINKKGQTPFDLAIDRKKVNAAGFLKSYEDDKESLPNVFKKIGQNKELRKLFTRIYPFLLLFYFAYILQMPISWFYKLVCYTMFYPITYIFKRLFFDRHITKYIPMATALAFIIWLYATWFIYFRPLVFDFSMYSLVFVLATSLSWYNFYKCYKTDPGILSTNRDQMNKTILQFVEQNEFSLEHFCTSCIIRKPLRSKHCADCDRCIAKFDHHCPWVDNCIGQNNLKYFIGFLFWTPVCLYFYMHGAITYYLDTCYPTDVASHPNMSSLKIVYHFMLCTPWVSFFTVIALFNMIWIGALCFCHFYQTVGMGITTNERINYKRYKYFCDSNGNYNNPFNFGVIQNFVDLIDIRICCIKPSLINWKREHDIQDVLNSRLDKKKEKYMEV